MSARVLITRDAERARGLVDLLVEKGIDVLVEPVTKTVYLHQKNPLPDLREFSWIAFTSVHGVVAFASVVQAKRLELPTNILFAVVGIATAAELEKRLHIFDSVVHGPESNAIGLARWLTEKTNLRTDDSLLWACSSLADEKFKEILIAGGLKVTSWKCYTTVAIPPEDLSLRLKRHLPWNIAVFAAPSAVSAFAAAWPPPWSFACVAFGESTAKALRQIGAGNIFISAGPDSAAVTAAVLKANITE
jgi:uroporphyrinogen-III synthase